MAKENLLWQPIDVTLNSKKYEGHYAIDGKTLRVRLNASMKETQLGGTPPLALARILMWELVEEENEFRPRRH